MRRVMGWEASRRRKSLRRQKNTRDALARMGVMFARRAPALKGNVSGLDLRMVEDRLA